MHSIVLALVATGTAFQVPTAPQPAVHVARVPPAAVAAPAPMRVAVPFAVSAPVAVAAPAPLHFAMPAVPGVAAVMPFDIAAPAPLVAVSVPHFPVAAPAPFAAVAPVYGPPLSITDVPEEMRNVSFPQDPADSLWRAARVRLDAGDARAAAELYRRLATERRYANSEYRAHAMYWEAFSRQRVGGTSELRLALESLAQLRSAYPRFENMTEVERLAARLNSELAERSGDASAGQRVSESVARVATQCPDQEIRVAVLEAFISMPAEQAMPTLRQVMSRRDDCSALLREKAVFIIAQKRNAETEDILLDAAMNDPSPKVREQAVFWLSQVPSEKAVAALESILRSATDPKAIEAAVFSISQQKSPRAAQILRELVTRADAPKEARKNAIFWLGQSRAEDVTPFMRDLYRQLNDAELKEGVLFALSQRRGNENADFLFEIALDQRETIQLRKTALFWAGQQRALPLERLGELYSSMTDREMREQIIFVISQRREPEAVDRLIEIVRTERDVELRKNAIFWLGQSKDPRAVRFLAELING